MRHDLSWRKLTVIGIAALCSVIVLLHKYWGSGEKLSSTILLSSDNNFHADETFPQDGVIINDEFTEDGPEPILWQSPSTKPMGAVFLAHGCGHGARDWWPPSPQCRSCGGYAEARRIRRLLLSRNFAVIAISSTSNCWSELDLEPVTKAVKRLQQKQKWENLPLYGFGASSGGAFVSVVYSMLSMAAIAVQIMPAVAVEKKFPPTIFSHMIKDKHTAEGVSAEVKQLKEFGVAAAEIQLLQRPITKSFFSDRMNEFTLTHSTAMYEAISGLLDNTTGFQLRDPRQNEWRHIIAHIIMDGAPGPRVPAGELDQEWEKERTRRMNIVAEQLNRAWGVHELSSDGIALIADWFITRGDRVQLAILNATHPLLNYVVQL